MAKLTLTGNLTKDPQMRENNGRKYLLLNIAENIRKKDENGECVKDYKGHYENQQTFYYSSFVNKAELVLNNSDLKSGQAIKVSGQARFTIQMDENGYDQYILDNIVATWIDTDPFKLGENTDDGESDESED